MNNARQTTGLLHLSMNPLKQGLKPDTLIFTDARDHRIYP